MRRSHLFTFVSGVLAAAVLSTGAALGAGVTGNPDADGWALGGHSLDKGTYVRESANYGFNVYSTVTTVASGSNLEFADGAYSWMVGDTVIGVGGCFADTTADDAGWAAFTGRSVNSLLGEGTKFVAKFGTANGQYSASAVAPGSGNGVGSTSAGGTGTVSVRSSGWFYASDWSAGSGVLQFLDKTDHINREGAVRPDTRVARLIWEWDAQSQHVSSWQILLNTSLLDRTAPADFSGLTPGLGDSAIVSVQNRDGAYTDALVTLAAGNAAPDVPEPMSMILGAMGLSSIAGFRRLRRK